MFIVHVIFELVIFLQGSSYIHYPSPTFLLSFSHTFLPNFPPILSFSTFFLSSSPLSTFSPISFHSSFSAFHVYHPFLVCSHCFLDPIWVPKFPFWSMTHVIVNTSMNFYCIEPLMHSTSSAMNLSCIYTI